MSPFWCDIRQLSRRMPRRILSSMERRSTTGLEFCLVCGRDFVSMVRGVRSGSGSWRLPIGPDDFQVPRPR
jgi:hypothetical protein